MSAEPSALEAWLAGRSPAVKEAARRYPPGTSFDTPRGRAWVVGYLTYAGREAPGLSLSFVNPVEDYLAAIAKRFKVCPECVAAGRFDRCRCEAAAALTRDTSCPPS